MAKVKMRQTVSLPTGGVLPAGSEVAVSDEDLAATLIQTGAAVLFDGASAAEPAESA